MTKEEQAVCDLWVAQKQELVAKIEKLQEEFEAAEKTFDAEESLRNEIHRTMVELGEAIGNPPEQIGIG